MSKIVVYWSGTGNTEDVANKIAQDLGCEAVSVSAVSVDEVAQNDVIVFGCPAMGSEELEEDEFRPFYEAVMAAAGGKKVALFGSYGWGDGEWMRNWQDEVVSLGGVLAGEGLIVNGDSSAIDDAAYQAFLATI